MSVGYVQPMDAIAFDFKHYLNSHPMGVNYDVFYVLNEKREAVEIRPKGQSKLLKMISSPKISISRNPSAAINHNDCLSSPIEIHVNEDTRFLMSSHTIGLIISGKYQEEAAKIKTEEAERAARKASEEHSRLHLKLVVNNQ